MDEGRKQNLTLNGPACLSVLRRIALNIVRPMDGDHSLKERMHIAGMNDKHLLSLLANAAGKLLKAKVLPSPPIAVADTRQRRYLKGHSQHPISSEDQPFHHPDLQFC